MHDKAEVAPSTAAENKNEPEGIPPALLFLKSWITFPKSGKGKASSDLPGGS
jgi:hypothetical protein